MERICVIMPAYNEEKVIGGVIRHLRQVLSSADIVVMNDGSQDDTETEALKAGATVISLPVNLGIGGAVQTGLKYAYRNGYDVALEVDSDGQHDPGSAREIISESREGGADMVIGSRFVADTAYRSSVMRRFGIHLFSWLILRATGRRIYDPTSGYRAYNRRALKLLSRSYPSDFPEPESIVYLLSNGLTIKEVPVEMKARQAGESVVGKSDFSLRAVYFVLSNAIAIMLAGLKGKRV